MKKQFRTRKLVKVYLDAEEHAKIEQRASGSVSAYVRQVILAEISGKDSQAKTPRNRALKTRTLALPDGVVRGADLELCACGHTEAQHYQGRSCQAKYCDCMAYVVPPE